MPKKKMNVKKEVMDRIRSGSVVMKPKIYFVFGSVLMVAGVIASFVISAFLVALGRFLLREHGPMGPYRLNQIMASFPWWLLPIAVLGIISGIILLKRYDFSYRKNFFVLAAGFIAAILVSGWLIDSSGLDEIWFRRGPMRGIMRQYMQDDRPGRFRQPNGFNR